MSAPLESFLTRHDLLNEQEVALLRSQRPNDELSGAAVEEGFLPSVLAEDARRLVDAGLEDGLDPRLPGLLLLAEVGKGARGTVYRAWQVGLRRLVAVKVFPREMLQRPEDRTRFVREARIAARLSHPSLMRAWDIGSSADVVFIVLEYVEGETLRARMERVLRESGGKVTWLPVAEAIRIGIAVADGLAFAAANGIAHRDIKPANIQLNDKSIAKILDLGLARPEGISEVTSPLTAPGTPAYLAPEQARGEGVLTPKCDVYALGLLLFRMLAGAMPYEAKSSDEMLRHHIHTPAPSLEARMKGRAAKLPEGFAGLVAQMLRKDPIQRPEAAFVAGALRMYLEKLGEPVPALTVPPSVIALPDGNGNGGGSSRVGRVNGGLSAQPPARAVSASSTAASGAARVNSSAASMPPAVESARAGQASDAAGSGVGRRWQWVAVGVGVLLAGLLVATLAVLQRNVGLEEELGRRERELRQRESDTSAHEQAIRKHAAALNDLARSAAKEVEAGVPLGSLEDRVKGIMEEGRRILEDPPAPTE